MTWSKSEKMYSIKIIPLPYMFISYRLIALNDTLKLEAINLTGKVGFKEFIHINSQHIVKCASITVPKANGYTYEYVSTFIKINCP